MDSETLKAGISAVSALIAMVSAAWAYRARVQTRADLYEAARDALILAMAENDAQSEVLALRVAYARSEIERIHPSKTTGTEATEAIEFLAHLDAIELLTKVLDRREYSPAVLDSFTYSEKRLTLMRSMSRNEQVNAKQLAPAAYDIVFSTIASFVKRHE
jgi:hypothetical protein